MSGGSSTGATKSGAAQLEPGAEIGAYRVEALIGEGGMGYVYRAVDPGGRRVALKIVRSDVPVDEQFRRRFAREARAAGRLRSSHVVPVIDAGEHGGMPYLVQELVSGGSLSERLEAEGRLELRATVRICLEVAAGLDAMHREGMVHRDVKPANVLFDEGERARIADFGLVKERKASVLTKPGQTVGSVEYMAPEQIRGLEVGAATDTYALGCVVFECLAGAPPFEDRRPMKVMWAQLREEPADPCAGRPELPAELGPAVLSALHKDFAGRPPTPIAYARVVQAAAGLPSLRPESR